MLSPAFDEEDDSADQWTPTSAVPDVGAVGDVGQNGAPIIDDEPTSEGPIEMPGDRAPPAEVEAPVPVMPPAEALTNPPADAPVTPPTPAPGPKTEPVGFTPTPVDTNQIPVPALPKDARLQVTQTIQSPEQNAVNADAAKLADEKAKAERNASAVREQQIKDEQDQAAKQTALALQKKEATEALIRDHDKRLSEAQARNDEAFANWKGAKFHDYWSDKTTGDRIVAALAVFLGGLGTAFGGENSAMKNLQSLIQRDYEKQKAEIDQKASLYEATSKNVERAGQMRAQAINDLNLKFGAATEAAAAQLAQMKLKQAIPAEQVQRDKNILAIYEDANKFKQQSAKDTNAMVTSDTYNKAKTGAGGPTGTTAAETKYLEMFQAGASGAELNAFAQANKIDNKRQDQLIQRGEKLAAGNRADAKLAGTGGSGQLIVVRDDQGNPIGKAPSSRNVHQITTRDADYARSADQLQRLLDDIEKNGNRVFTPEAIKRRNTLFENAKIAVATVSPLGKTDEAMKTESASLGSSGAPSVHDKLGILAGANPDAIRQKIEELKVQRQRYRHEELTPLTPEEVTAATKGRGTGIPGEMREHLSTGKPSIPTDAKERRAKAISAAAAAKDPTKTPAQRKKALEYLQSIGAR